MEFINYLKEEAYQVANLNGNGKAPGINEWNTIPNLYDKCNLNKDKFFLRTGDQLNMDEFANEDFILGLDFDVYKKKCKDNQHKKHWNYWKHLKLAMKAITECLSRQPHITKVALLVLKNA